MALKENGYYRDLRNLEDECKKYLYYHTTLTMTDGSTFDGIIENVDKDSITVLVGEDVMEDESENQSDEQRQPFGHGRPRRRFRRFRRRKFSAWYFSYISLITLHCATTISLLSLLLRNS